MADIPQLYSIATNSNHNGIEGYHIQKKYIDAKKIREQRIMSLNRAKSVSVKPINVGKKTSFFDEVIKISSKLPSPCQYDPKQYVGKSKMSELVVNTDRKTIFDEMEHQEKKDNYPGAGTYIKMILAADKTKLRSDLPRAQSPTYLEASMRNSLDCPGVGNYNSYRSGLDRRGVKISIPTQPNKKITQPKLPPVGTYNPNPISFDLFSNKARFDKRKGKSEFAKEQRFKKDKDKKVPFYNILSQWGMKDKTHKKDIMSKVSTHVHKSVYY